MVDERKKMEEEMRVARDKQVREICERVAEEQF